MKNLLLCLGAFFAQGYEIEYQLGFETNEFVFNESCTDTGQAQICTNKCDSDFTSCISDCNADDYKCKQSCNRELTTCVDREY